jgi:hypothetical protein
LVVVGGGVTDVVRDGVAKGIAVRVGAADPLLLNEAMCD